jgi:hypothetical protein
MRTRWILSGALCLVVAMAVRSQTVENATPQEIAFACNAGRSGDTISVLATVAGNQGTYFFHTGEGVPSSGFGGQCVATFLGFIRDGLTVTIP